MSTVREMPLPYRRVLTLPLSRSEIVQWVLAADSKIRKNDYYFPQ